MPCKLKVRALYTSANSFRTRGNADESTSPGTGSSSSSPQDGIPAVYEIESACLQEKKSDLMFESQPPPNFYGSQDEIVDSDEELLKEMHQAQAWSPFKTSLPRQDTSGEHGNTSAGSGAGGS